ncbi:hypothetical protein CC86DRAFT_435494 [Ophiobolus disseminans]|uniref:Uncharacterized protein n=1 Tax=Ophiobolus disseminans TaxID=1469910 RepID=A0A6A7AAC0_9PLEO|nr:hypothetical protein CC86DRAFT_435494 [Ophiobolus disseminans]
MAATLPRLPMELLVQIAGLLDNLMEPQAGYKKLRAVNRFTNEKLFHRYGQKWYKNVNVPLCAKGRARLRTISRGQLGFHVQSVTIRCNPLLEQYMCNCSSESSDASGHSWYQSDRSLNDLYFTKIAFSEDTPNFLLDGACADLLGPALSNMPSLRTVNIVQPGISEGLRKVKLEELKARLNSGG